LAVDLTLNQRLYANVDSTLVKRLLVNVCVQTFYQR